MDDLNAIESVRLSSGDIVLADLATGDAEEDVGLGHLDFTSAAAVIKTCIADIMDPLKQLEVSRLSVTMSFDLAIESGKLTAAIVKGSAKGSIQAQVEWSRS